MSILIQIESRNKHGNDQKVIREFRSLMATLHDIVLSEENEYVLSDIFEISLIFSFPKGLSCLSKDFKFDFLCAIVTKTETGSIICYSGTWRARLMNRILLSRVCITYCLCMNRKWSLNVYQYAKKVSIVMLNNSTIINKTNSHLSPQIIKHIKDHDIY